MFAATAVTIIAADIWPATMACYYGAYTTITANIAAAIGAAAFVISVLTLFF